MVHVLLIGGTGVLGRAVVPRLVEAGHAVTAVARRPDAAARLREAGAAPTALDLFDAEAATHAADGCDAVVNLATAIPAVPLPRRRWAANDRLRRDASRALATAASRVGARFVQESFAAALPDGGSGWLDGAGPLDPVDQTRSLLDAEAAAASVTAAGGIGIVLRFGLFYDAGSPSSRQMVDLVRRGRHPLPGRPGAHVTMVHVEDAATAVVAALDVPAGTYAAVESEPLTREDHARALAAALGLPPPRPLPRVVDRLPVVRVLARSQRIDGSALRDAAGWAPRHPSPREGWAASLGSVAGAR